jgi:site-specific DNA-methyltransferase (adenine-specific)
MVAYVNRNGRESGRPYFSEDGETPLSGPEWTRLRSKFYCEVGVTNVWSQPALRGSERVKDRQRALHHNQKPLDIVELIIRSCTDKGDVIWEPFGGLCPGAVVSHRLKRCYVGAEVQPAFFLAACERLALLPDRQSADLAKSAG